MSAAAANLTPYHTLPFLPSNLAVANLSIETLGIELFLIITVAQGDDEGDDEGDDDDDEGVTTVLDTPLRPITLAIRSPEAPPPPSRAPSPLELMTVSRSFPESPFVRLAGAC